MSKALTRILFFINPKSGSVRLDELIRDIENLFSSKKYEYEIILANRKASIETQVREACNNKDYDILAAAGGDGTVSTLAHVVANLTKKPRFGIIPVGTANILAREVGVPLDTHQALTILKQSTAYKEIDALEANGILYFLRISVGISSLTIQNLTGEEKRLYKSFAYIRRGMINHFGFNRRTFTLHINHSSIATFKASDIVVTNFGRLLFPFITLGPTVQPDDGLADVLVFKKYSITQMLKLIYKMMFHRVHTRKDRDLAYFSHVNTITIESRKRLPVQADGDIIGYTPVTIKLVPRILKIITPE